VSKTTSITSHAADSDTHVRVDLLLLANDTKFSGPLGPVGGRTMKIDLFKRVALKIDIPDQGLRKGDVATIVEHLPGKNTEDGYALEVFNAVGESIAVVMVPESAVEPLTADKIPSVRPLAKTA
jgi:hypothetical protein